MADDVLRRCAFATDRLLVGEWHRLADSHDIDLVRVVEQTLTPASTSWLPPHWQGAFDAARSLGWIADRDAESPTLLVLDVEDARPVGLVVLFGVDGATGLEIRLGYVLAEPVWGRGLATELVRGLVAWARNEPAVGAITAGVADGNEASVRVLLRAGFEPVDPEGDVQRFRVDVRSA